ncbi:hypothetical protein M1N46_03650, partial [Dehalococcoidia bacterium]|nr:hypothetical protein [Dehalococcoidia bacterium]
PRPASREIRVPHLILVKAPCSPWQVLCLNEVRVSLLHVFLLLDPILEPNRDSRNLHPLFPGGVPVASL